jgi:hypothetical protein
MKRAPFLMSVLFISATLSGALALSSPDASARTYRRTETVTTRRNGRVVNRRTTRFVRRDFSFTGRVKHDTNMFRRSIVIIGSDGIRRRIDVPRDTPVYDNRVRKSISIHDIHNGDWIRITGVQTDRKRWRADRITLLRKG